MAYKRLFGQYWAHCVLELVGDLAAIGYVALGTEYLELSQAHQLPLRGKPLLGSSFRCGYGSQVFRGVVAFTPI